MIKTLSPVRSDDRLPKAVDVAVIGGGIIGVSAALYLAERGISTLLCEKGQIAGEQSGRNWGWCRKQGRDPREIPLTIESLRLWEDMNRRTGRETGFVTSGVIYLADSEREMANYEAWSRLAAQHQIESQTVAGAQLEELTGPLGRGFAGALFTPSDGRAEPFLAAPALAEAAREKGASLHTSCAVRGIETKAGRVSGIVTEKGSLACSSVILAGGAWSSLFAGSLGLKLPQLKVRSSVFRTTPYERGPEISLAGPDFAFRKRQDGGYTIAEGRQITHELVPDSLRFFREFLPMAWLEKRNIDLRFNGRFGAERKTPRSWSLDGPSPFEDCRILDPAPDPRILKQAMSNLLAAFPQFAGLEVVESWAGMIDVTPDAVPVISPVESLPGLVIATGFSGHGFGIGPAAGQLAGELATGAAPLVDPEPYRFSRFSDGSPIKLFTGL